MSRLDEIVEREWKAERQRQPQARLLGWTDMMQFGLAVARAVAEDAVGAVESIPVSTDGRCREWKAGLLLRFRYGLTERSEP